MRKLIRTLLALVAIAPLANATPTFTIHGNTLVSVDMHGESEAIIPDGVEGIRDEAFKDCLSLTTLIIPVSVTSIGGWAFYGCSNLTRITFRGDQPTVASDTFEYVNPNCLIRIPNDRIYNVNTSWHGLTVERYDPAEESDAESGTCSAVIWTISNGELTDVNLNGETDVTIPSSVTVIGDHVFRGSHELTSVVIGDAVTRIGTGAFSDCTALERVVIGSKVTEIGSFAFSDCNALTNVTIVGCLTCIENAVFMGCRSLTEITLPDSVTSIGNDAFADCSSLRSFTIPSAVTRIDSGAFDNCDGLTDIVIPDGVSYIGTSVFGGCSSLTNIAVGIDNEDYSSVNGMLLSKDGRTLLQGINGEVIIPESVTNIGYRSFWDRSGLLSVSIGESVLSIGKEAFCGCSSLRNVTIGKSVADIGESAFGCVLMSFIVDGENPMYSSVDGLLLSKDGTLLVKGVDRAVTIPKSVISIGDCAFKGCGTLTDVDIPDSVTNVGSLAFHYCRGLTNVVIGNNVVRIGSFAFQDCDKLVNVTLPDSVVNVEQYAFSWCGGLTNVTMGAGVKSIGDGAFSRASITDVTVPETVTNIGRFAFSSCKKLSLALLPSHLSGTVSVEDQFGYCASDLRIVFYNGGSEDIRWIDIDFDVNGGELTTASISVLKGETVGNLPIPTRTHYRFMGWFTESIGGERVTATSVLNTSAILYAHWESTIDTIYTANGVCLQVEFGTLLNVNLCGATTLIIPNCVTNIGLNALCYSDRRNLTSVLIPNSVTNVEGFAFGDCNRIKSVTVPQCICNEELRTVFPDSYASITNVVIADGVSSIAEFAFSGCSELISVTIPNSVTNIGKYAFAGLGNLTAAFVPSRLKDIVTQNNAFLWCNSNLQIAYYDESEWLTVRFDANGRETDLALYWHSATKNCVRGFALGDLPLSADPCFLGWFTQREGGEEVTSETIATESMTLYAHWAPRPILVYAMADGDSQESVSVVADGTTNSAAVFLVYPSDDGMYATNITFEVKAGFEICKVMTNGVNIADACNARDTWTLSVTLSDAQNFYVVVSAHLIGCDKIPMLDENASLETISNALVGVVDTALRANITNAVQYGSYRDWALSVTNETVTAKRVKASSQAWLSYALGADALVEKEITSEDLKIESFTSDSMDGRFDFVVGVDGVNIGAGSVAEEILKENLKKMFGLEGGASLDDLSTSNINITFGTPENGKVKFTAGPKNANEGTFFMRVKMTP